MCMYMKRAHKAWIIVLVFGVVFSFGIAIVHPAYAAPPSAGQIVGTCVGWPTPHIEIRWAVNPPLGSLAPNSNSVLRNVNSAGNQWFFAGAAPGVYATRISGAIAPPWGAGGYPNPNYTVYDLRDNLVQVGSTYAYTVKYRPETPSNTYTTLINAANCGGVPPPAPTPTPGANDGRITGYCTWNSSTPQVHLSWSQNPPPGQIATTNTLQKGDCYPGDPNSYWCALPNGPTQYAFTDTTVLANTQYQYRVKYRPDLSSLNTYNIFTSATNCGVPPPTPGPLSLSPNFQTVPPNVSAILTATGGDGSYTWSAPTGAISGTGSVVGVVFTNTLITPVYKTVTVMSAGQAVTATVQVDGIQTYLDDIILDGRGPRFVLINDDAPVATSPDVVLTLAHGFSNEAEANIRMKLGNTADQAAAAIERPFQKNLPWNLCTGLLLCGDGMYTVYAVYRPFGGTVSPTVMDNIVYLKNPQGDKPSVTINGGATMTEDRLVTLTLTNGLQGIPPDEITMQIANRQDLLDVAKATLYSPVLAGWDLCAGLGPTCANGAKTVYAKFCARGDCTVVAQDDILLQSLWPNWGVIINDDAASTNTRIVQLRLNPWFDKPGTEVFVSNMSDFSVLSTTSFKELVPWDLCTGLSLCNPENHSVFVRYINYDKATLWPGPQSPDYQDDIALRPPAVPSPTAIPTPSGSVSPTPGGPVSPAVTPSVSPGSSGIPTSGSTPLSVFMQALSGASGIIGQISVASAIALAVTAIVASVPILGSSGAARFMRQWLMGVLGLLPKRKKVWGTVYDANTKRPIPFAKVQLMDRNKRTLETHIADRDGRYGFLTTPESLSAQNVQIAIQSNANGYLFPSHTAASVDTFVYNNLYYGDLITVSDKTLINFDIPMDPVRPSVAPLLLKSPSIVLGASVVAIADAGFWLGLIMVPLNVFLAPTPLNFGVLFLFLGTASLRIWGISEHPFGTVTDSATGRPMPFTLITLNDLSGARVGFTVSDEQGRYFLVADRGTYEMTMVTPATVIPMRQKKQIIEARKGWITREIKI